MTVAITCESLKELQELAQRLVVLAPETRTVAKPEADPVKKGKETKAKKEPPKISADDVRKLHEYGMKPKQIAEKLGCSEATVYNKLKE